jgi:hypothetical protein
MTNYFGLAERQAPVQLSAWHADARELFTLSPKAMRRMANVDTVD